MIKNLLHLIVWLYALVGANAQAIDVEGFLYKSNGKPAENVAVFLYLNQGAMTNPQANFQQVTYTDQNGKYQATLSSFQGFDTLGVGVIDCFSNFHYVQNTVGRMSVSQTWSLKNITIACAPVACQNFLKKEIINKGRHLALTSTPLINPSHGLFTEKPRWIFTDGTTQKGRSITKNIHHISGHSLGYCFSSSPICSMINCDTINIFNNPTLPNCNAEWQIDTVNSLAFDGNVVIWNQSMSQGHSTLFTWNFGDGHTSNKRFPTHHYKDTGVYNVCLRIASISGSDTCLAKHCGLVGLDNHGNLVYKQNSNGFTLNVVNPQSVGKKETMLSSFSFYPNPASSRLKMEWPESENIYRVNIYNIQGVLVFTKDFDTSLIENIATLNIEDLEIGTYFIKAITTQGAFTRKVLIKD